MNDYEPVNIYKGMECHMSVIFPTWENACYVNALLVDLEPFNPYII